ncbi:MAG: mechanosensitive ion channel [Prolixibacteraceae bacterium]|jgi:miniconductance mechanosensitive channel|nr:mechanosensitive ion channel [Prolixibacteraceae bacterium]
MLALNRILFKWLFSLTENIQLSANLSTSIVGLSIFIIALLLLFILRKIFVRFAHRFAKSTKTEWDDILIKYKFFYSLAHFAPALYIYFNASFANLQVPGTEELFFSNLQVIFLRISEVYFLGASIFLLNAFLSSVNEIYNKTFSFAKERPIAGFIQLIKIFIYFVGVLILISLLFDKELSKLFTGLGAMAAILILVFKDTILGFVASIQISMNDMVKIGDWINMPSRGADGDVIEINLTTVKVQNWDKTITMLPTYSLISESFVNWKGMEQSGGRRIMRSININMSSVKFCSSEMLKKLEKFVLIREYINDKENEIAAFNSTLKIDPKDHYNGRRQTNLGIFRKYLEAYLKNHPMINQEMTFLIRHLQPSEKGLPIEIYVFCKDQRWANYEAIQSDIFDHILAVIPEFDLMVFQNPTGSDFNRFINNQ